MTNSVVGSLPRGPFIRKVPTASGALAVQIMHKRGRRVVGIEHIGSAHDEAQLAVLMELTRQRLHEGQQELKLTPAFKRFEGIGDVADFSAEIV